MFTDKHSHFLGGGERRSSCLSSLLIRHRCKLDCKNSPIFYLQFTVIIIFVINLFYLSENCSIDGCFTFIEIWI